MATNTYDMLRLMGLNSAQATNAQPMMFFAPGTVSPYSSGVIVMVRGLQRALTQMGYHVRTDGFIGAATVQGFESISGPNWKAKSWAQICNDVIDALRTNHRAPVAREGTAMGYLGLGTLSSTNYCTVKNPQGNCKPLPGIAKPMDVSTLNVFKDLQNQLNRVAQATGGSKIQVDGRIGGDTIAAVKRGKGKTDPNSIGPSVTTYNEDLVAMFAPEFASWFRAWADGHGAPSVVAAAPQRRPVIVPQADGSVHDPMNHADAISAIGTLPLPAKLALGGVGVVALMLLVKGEKKGKKKPAKRRAPRRRRRMPRTRITRTYY